MTQHCCTCSVDVCEFVSWLGSKELVTDLPRRCLGKGMRECVCFCMRVCVSVWDASEQGSLAIRLCTGPLSVAVLHLKNAHAYWFTHSLYLHITISLSIAPLSFICLSCSHLTSSPLLSFHLFSHSVLLALQYLYIFFLTFISIAELYVLTLPL